jgi:ABC-type transport system involved in cytochrome bd biosynthesis fused ATPase/permease subunit
MFNVTTPKVRKQLLELLTNRSAIICLIVLTIQQLVEASSTIWLVKLMATITLGENFFPYLILYLSCLAFPYIPLCIANILKISWKQEAQRSFINAFVASNRGNIGEWSNKGIKEEKLSILSNEGPMALHGLIDYVWDVYTYVLSVIFNVLALTIVVEPLFFIAYGFSVSIVIIVMKLQRRSQRLLTQKALTARIDLCQSLLAAWDNVLLGNEYNYKLWEEKTSQRLKRCLQRNVDLERFDQVLAIFVALMTSIPTLLVVIYCVITYRSDPAKLASFVVILPLLFMILSYTYQTLTLVFRWTMHRSKLISIYKAIQGSKDSHTELEKKVKWSKIMLSHCANNILHEVEGTPSEPINSHAELIQHASTKGRHTIRGDNGTGKSTALMLIKNALADRAFLLPTHNQLSFISQTNKYSTGESLRNRLLEILERVDLDVLLLDEWDANLDKANQEKLSELIDKLAENKCVIEVRHR